MFSALALAEAEPSNSFIEKSISSDEPKTKQIPTDFTDCGFSESARDLARLISQDYQQMRTAIRCDKELSQIALDKAKEMAELGEVSHKGKFEGPNARLLAYGYPLTDLDKNQFNSVEAILGGEEYSDEVWFRFKNSYSHKIHLLGEHEYYLKQTQLGVGSYIKEQSPHREYWAVYFVEKSNKQD